MDEAVWIKFANTALSAMLNNSVAYASFDSIPEATEQAARYADEMTIEYNKRFAKNDFTNCVPSFIQGMDDEFSGVQGRLNGV